MGGWPESIQSVTWRSCGEAMRRSCGAAVAPDITRTREDGGMAFVGRSVELRAVVEALRGVETDGAALVVVEGEAGIGKTALVAEAARRAGMASRRAKADELSSVAPFATLTSALRVRPDATAESLLDEFAALLGAGPLVLVLDDAQWLDPASVLVLDRLVDELADHPLAVVLPMRPLPRLRELDALVSRPSRRLHVVLQAMPREELEELIASSDLPVAPDSVPLDEVGGNPLYALELAAAVAGEGAGTAGLAPPLSVTILRRLSYLGEATLLVLRAGALLGAAFDLADLVLISERSAPEVVHAVEQATKAGVLRPEGRRLRFSHDLVRSALYEDIPAVVRAYEHRRIGAAMAEAGRAATDVAVHYELVATPGDPEAIRWLHEAAMLVGKHSSEACLDLLRRALALGPRDRALEEELTAQLTAQLGRTGRFDEVIEVAQRAMSNAPSQEAAVTITISLAQALNGRGRAAEACRLLEERAAQATPAQRARLIGMLASTRLSDGDAAGAQRAADDAVAVATAVGDSHWLRSTWAIQSWLATGAGDPETGMRLAHAAIDPSDDDPYAAVFNRLALGAAQLEADLLDEAEATFRRAIAEAESSGAEANITLAHLGVGLCAYAAGRLDDAVTSAETALALAESKSNRTSDLYAVALVARVALHRQGPSGAAPLVASARARLDATGPALGAELVVWVEAVHGEARGTPPDLDLLALVWHLHPLRYLLTWRMLAPDLIRWSAHAGRTDLVATVLGDVEAVAGSGGIVGRRAVRDRCRVAAGLPEAAPTGGATPRPLERAAIAGDEAGRALAAGDVERGVELLRQAHATYEAVGARADADATAQLARRHRVRLEAPVRSASGSSSAALTAAEREVARLAARGLTNRAIGSELAMSRHTVDTHLRHVYRKLEIAGRVELARHPAVS